MDIDKYMKTRGLPAANNLRNKIAEALGTIQMRQLEDELEKQFGRSLLEQIERDIDSAFGYGMEEAENRAAVAGISYTAWRRERFMEALSSDEAKSMTKEQREIYALRAYIGHEYDAEIVD